MNLFRTLGFCLLAALISMPAVAQIDPVPDQAVLMIEQLNAKLEESGSPLRLVKASFFTQGRGIDDFRRLRTGTKWPYNNLTYVIDGSDVTVDVPAGEVVSAIQNGYESWNAIANTSINVSQIPDGGANIDVLDGTFHPVSGACLSLYDLSSPNLNLATGQIFPAADIVVGGWLPAAYFSKCLGSSSILGVTFTFAAGDVNGDNYVDNLYVEQYYNEGFQWVTSGSVFLGPTNDIESVVVHENGHALGLDHFGGPNVNQPFKLHPNGRVFSPEAVMNPYSLGGEKRDPLPTDVAALRTLY